MDAIRQEIVPYEALTPEFGQEIEGHYHQVFHFEITTIKEWNVPEWMLITWLGETWVGLVELSTRTITVGGAALRVGGIGGVYVLEQQRGKGVASAAVRRAVEFLCAEQKTDFVLLLCGDHRLSFYAGLGWQHVNNPAIYHQTTGVYPLTAEFNRMIYACGSTLWPAGEIDFCGRPW